MKILINFNQLGGALAQNLEKLFTNGQKILHAAPLDYNYTKYELPEVSKTLRTSASPATGFRTKMSQIQWLRG